MQTYKRSTNVGSLKCHSGGVSVAVRPHKGVEVTYKPSKRHPKVHREVLNG